MFFLLTTFVICDLLILSGDSVGFEKQFDFLYIVFIFC